MKAIVARPDLVDKLGQFDHDRSDGLNLQMPKGQVLYPEHLSSDEIQQSLRSNPTKYKQGQYSVNRDNYLEAYVFVSGGQDNDGERYFIQGDYSIFAIIYFSLVLYNAQLL